MSEMVHEDNHAGVVKCTTENFRVCPKPSGNSGGLLNIAPYFCLDFKKEEGKEVEDMKVRKEVDWSIFSLPTFLSCSVPLFLFKSGQKVGEWQIWVEGRMASGSPANLTQVAS